MGDTLGGKLGTRVADIINRAALDRLDRSAPTFSRIGMALQEDFFRLTGFEVANTIGPMFADIAAHPQTPPWMKSTAQFVANGKGQWATLLAGSATGALFGAGLLSVFTNWLQPSTGELIREHPNAPLSIPDAAQADIRGLSWGPDLWLDAGQLGINRDRYNVIKALASQTLSAEYIVQLLNRELVTPDFAAKMLRRGGWDTDHADWFFKLRRSLISIQDAAAMQNRDIVTVDEGRAIARHNGYTDDDFDRFNLLGGEPPDTTSLILAWRRGVITESDVDRALIQGPLRREWIPVIKDLQYQPLDPQELANAVNQGHMDLDVATNVATQSGIRPADFRVILDNAGIPPGPQEALDWVSRGIITEDQFTSIFLESRVKNKYVPLYLKARSTILTMAEIRSLFAKGAMTQEQAVTRLLMRGYTPEDAGIILAGAKADKTTSTKDLSVTQTTRLYGDRIIDAATALTMLVALGYDDAEAQQILDLTDTDRALKFVNAAVSVVRSKMVGHHITTSEASDALDQLRVPPDARDDMLTIWQLEAQVSTKDLTAAEILSAVKKGVFDVTTGFNRLQGIGYTSDDALVKLKIAGDLPVDAVEGDLP
jgi:hypothetical protein